MIVLLLTTQNEADVLRLNLEHHLAWGVDHVAVCDNRSTDHTQDVLAGFGDAVTQTVFEDFAQRQSVRKELLDRIRERHGQVDWVGVSDTDEFFWAPDATMPDLLADAPDDVVAVTFHQRLFLPTALDAAEGPVYARQLHRTGNYDTPLHTSYREGKTFYRGAWLGKIRSEHRNYDVPHDEWGPPEPRIHHYMIRDEEQFVMKVKRLTSWRPREGLKSKPWYHKARAVVGLKPERPFVAGFKQVWWDAYDQGGESGLRDYYRNVFRIPEAEVARHVETGDLVRDDAFARFRAGSC